MPPGQLTVNKKTDYALTYDHNHPEISPTYQELQAVGSGYQISQMKHDHTASQAMLCGVEVKANAGSKEEAQLQLVTWMAAGLINIRKLQDSPAARTNLAEHTGQEAEADGVKDEIMPLCGWIIVGHSWEFYMGFEHPGEANKIVSLPLQSAASPL